MRWVDKRSKPPARLLAHAKQGETWHSLDAATKTELRAALVEDQHLLCCYCMRRVDVSTATVEHFLPQSAHPEQALARKNLLAACDGERGQPHANQTCDARKGDREIGANPTERRTTEAIRYSASGEVACDDEQLRSELHDALNLNHPKLVRGRNDAQRNLQLALTKRLGRGTWAKSKLEAELERLRAKQKLPEYFGVIEYWLARAIQRR